MPSVRQPQAYLQPYIPRQWLLATGESAGGDENCRRGGQDPSANLSGWESMGTASLRESLEGGCASGRGAGCEAAKMLIIVRHGQAIFGRGRRVAPYAGMSCRPVCEQVSGVFLSDLVSGSASEAYWKDKQAQSMASEAAVGGLLARCSTLARRRSCTRRHSVFWS